MPALLESKFCSCFAGLRLRFWLSNATDCSRWQALSYEMLRMCWRGYVACINPPCATTAAWHVKTHSCTLACCFHPFLATSSQGWAGKTKLKADSPISCISTPTCVDFRLLRGDLPPSVPVLADSLHGWAGGTDLTGNCQYPARCIEQSKSCHAERQDKGTRNSHTHRVRATTTARSQCT